MNQEKIEAALQLVVGGLGIGVGGYLSTDAWTTMQRIEAQGIVGQAFNQGAYDAAASDFRLFTVITILGFAIVVIGSATYVAATVKEAG